MNIPSYTRWYYAFVLPILEYCSPVWGSAAECHLKFLERQVYAVARLCPDQTFLSLCHRRHIDAQCMLHKVNSNSNHCLFSELLSASVRVRHTRAKAAAHPLDFEVSRCDWRVLIAGPIIFYCPPMLAPFYLLFSLCFLSFDMLVLLS